MTFDLPSLWAAIIAFAVLAYVILDGFDLGIGLLFPALSNRDERLYAMNTIAPVWDGNETWLVLGGGGLFAVFPLAYAVVMPALYPLIIFMLLGLIFRGVAFEFVHRSERMKGFWEWGFCVGSFVATLSQGLALGALVQGITVEGRAFGGGIWDWLTPFSVLTAVALTVSYAALGATWLVMKTKAGTELRARRLAEVAGAAMVVLIGLVSLATLAIRPEYAERWFQWPMIVFSLVVPLLVLIAARSLWTGLRSGATRRPFLSVVALFVLSFTGLGISFYPNIVPPAMTIHEAAAPDSSLWFLLVGAVVLIPTILTYTAYSYWVFRGKIGMDEGYH